jgi:hypothetical protein
MPLRPLIMAVEWTSLPRVWRLSEFSRAMSATVHVDSACELRAPMTKRDHRLADDLHDLVASARRDRERRNSSYRSRALALFPPVCARCGRDFAGKRIRELTVHHKDHNHDNNPPDGSNWELLCLYCHEIEHARKAVAAIDSSEDDAIAPATYQPFAGLDKVLKKSR